MSIISQQVKKSWPITVLFLSSILLLTPFFLDHAMIIGSDTIFHFNRLYDTAMQMKHGNFQYFISMYGFQSSGRIVNALYGPSMAYLQGMLVLISPSWFDYQVLSNGILYFISACSLYVLLKKAGVRVSYRIPLSILYMTTYSVQYWTLRQGFSSWGAALFPVCLIPLINLIEKKTLSAIQTAICIGIMCQIHMLSAMLLVLVYACFYCATFFTNNIEIKIKLLKQLGLAILIFSFLVLNILYSFIAIYSTNNIAQPFINKWMAETTIFRGSSYWLFYPPILMVVMLFVLWQACRHWKKASQLLKVTTISSMLFFILCTDLFPWKILNNSHNQLIETIQFPFRFFVPFTVLLLLALGLILQKWHIKSTVFGIVCYILLVFSLIQTSMSTSNALRIWHQTDSFLNSTVHTYLTSTNTRKIKNSFFISDKEQSLKYVVKSTPDYLPIENTTCKNKYELYYHLVIDKQKYFKKSVQNNKLVVQWQGRYVKNIQVPIIKYANTVLVLNHKQLHGDVKHGKIGTPIVKQQKGWNQLVVYYRRDCLLTVILLVNCLSWVTVVYTNYKFK
ncbi:hypothetical protein [Leuconostoc litchii]|uniref:Cell division protein n=2 Tax=Leuconostoc litchii TaxID=1981069 RepID=A0A6P2CM90_9LACO|nr:hypothetical protein [Leuconostoc litchii]TYC47135.1 hypothetical protein ESZ47_03095 [Leuconostoc litchii]